MRPIPVVAAVIFRGERMLVCQRPHHKRYGGLWEFPGGKCLPGESLADAARRELREELGVQVEDVGSELLSLPDPDSVYVINFTRVNITGEPVCHEHIALYWGTPSELQQLPLAPCDRLYVDNLLVGLSN